MADLSKLLKMEDPGAGRSAYQHLKSLAKGLRHSALYQTELSPRSFYPWFPRPATAPWHVTVYSTDRGPHARRLRGGR